MPEKIKLKCPECGAGASGGEHLLEKQIKCPKCGKIVTFVKVQTSGSAAPVSESTSKAKLETGIKPPLAWQLPLIAVGLSAFMGIYQVQTGKSPSKLVTITLSLVFWAIIIFSIFLIVKIFKENRNDPEKRKHAIGGMVVCGIFLLLFSVSLVHALNERSRIKNRYKSAKKAAEAKKKEIANRKSLTEGLIWKHYEDEEFGISVDFPGFAENKKDETGQNPRIKSTYYVQVGSDGSVAVGGWDYGLKEIPSRELQRNILTQVGNNMSRSSATKGLNLKYGEMENGGLMRVFEGEVYDPKTRIRTYAYFEYFFVKTNLYMISYSYNKAKEAEIVPIIKKFNKSFQIDPSKINK